MERRRGYSIGIAALLGWIPYLGVRISLAIDGVSFRSQAIQPDFAWLRSVIETDRQRRLAPSRFRHLASDRRLPHTPRFLRGGFPCG